MHSEEKDRASGKGWGEGSPVCLGAGDELTKYLIFQSQKAGSYTASDFQLRERHKC